MKNCNLSSGLIISLLFSCSSDTVNNEQETSLKLDPNIKVSEASVNNSAMYVEALLSDCNVDNGGAAR